MKTTFRITDQLMDQIHLDLSRRHRFAHERVGFICCQIGEMDNELIVLAQRYEPVADEDYLESDRVGAMMGPSAIRKALQAAYQRGYAMFHVHRHEHLGAPDFSRVDLTESAKFVPDFWKVAPRRPHGAIVLSRDAAEGLIWHASGRAPAPVENIYSIGRGIARLGGL